MHTPAASADRRCTRRGRWTQASQSCRRQTAGAAPIPVPGGASAACRRSFPAVMRLHRRRQVQPIAHLSATAPFPAAIPRCQNRVRGPGCPRRSPGPGGATRPNVPRSPPSSPHRKTRQIRYRAGGRPTGRACQTRRPAGKERGVAAPASTITSSVEIPRRRPVRQRSPRRST